MDNSFVERSCDRRDIAEMSLVTQEKTHMISEQLLSFQTYIAERC